MRPPIYAPPSLRSHAVEVLAAIVARVVPDCPDIHEPIAEAIFNEFSKVGWARMTYDTSTYADPDEELHARQVSAVFGGETGRIEWRTS